MVVGWFRGFEFVVLGVSERRCCLSRSVGLEGGGRGGGELGCSVVGVVVEALFVGCSVWFVVCCYVSLLVFGCTCNIKMDMEMFGRSK